MYKKARMVSYQPKQAMLDKKEKEELQPISLASQCINNSILSFCILAFTESEIPIDYFKIFEFLKNDFLRFNPCFSSIIVTDNKGVQWWKKVEVRVEDHVVVPTFARDLSPEIYDQHFKDYLTKIATDQLNKNQPLWEVHIFQYPRQNSAGTLVFKIHHAIGDGFSILGALFSCLKRADDPALPLTFPVSSSSSLSLMRSHEEMNICKKVLKFASGFCNTVSDFVWNVLQSTLHEDSRTPIRSRKPQVEFLPIDITCVTFSLNDIRQIKRKIGGTLNDVITGVLFYGIHLYTQKVDKMSTNSRNTALVLMNTRMVRGYQSVEDMQKNDTWGNNFSFIQIPIPSCNHEEDVDPLMFVLKARETIKRKRKTMNIYLNGLLLRTIASIRGTEAMSRYIHSTIRNSSIAISNLIGPIEKLAVGGHPINGFYFSVLGAPHSLAFTMLSYIGKLQLLATMEKGFIDSQLLVSSLNESFEKIFKAACEKDAMGTN